MHIQSRLRSQYVHLSYSAEQVLQLHSLAQQSSFSPSSAVQLIRSAESNRCRLRTLHARVKTRQVFYPAYVSYIQEQRAVLRMLEKGEAASGGTRTDAGHTNTPLVDQSTTEWWVDATKGWIRVKRHEASYQAKLANGAFGDVVEAGCGRQRLVKVYGTGYLGYTHRVIVAPPKKDAIEVLFLECDSDWLLLLAMHLQPPLVALGKQSSFWEYVFGDCCDPGKRLNTSFISTVQGTAKAPWGERCYVVSLQRKDAPANEQVWLWFSIPKGLICVRAVWVREDSIKVWNADTWQHSNGVWFPKSGKFEEYFSLPKASDRRASSGYILAREVSFIVEPFTVNTLLPEQLFTVSPPPSAWVDDHFRGRLYPYGKPVATRHPQRVLALEGLGAIAILSYVAWKVYRKRQRSL